MTIERRLVRWALAALPYAWAFRLARRLALGPAGALGGGGRRGSR